MMRKYYNTYSDLPKWKAVWKSLAFADVYTCAPPRLFIPVMCLLQFCVFVHYKVSGKIIFSKLHFLKFGGIRWHSFQSCSSTECQHLPNFEQWFDSTQFGGFTNKMLTAHCCPPFILGTKTYFIFMLTLKSFKYQSVCFLLI